MKVSHYFYHSYHTIGIVINHPPFLLILVRYFIIFWSNFLNTDIAEVSVEDPAPGFQRLRDSVDCEWLQAVQSSLMHAADISECSTESSAGSRFGSRAMADATTDKTVVQSHQAAEKSLRSGAFKDCARILKITIQQATFAVEALRYCRIGEDEEIGEIEDTDEDDDGSVAECEALRRFRLDVKRRLLAVRTCVIHCNAGS